MYTARRMMSTEFKTKDDFVKRDAAGRLCGYAVEHESGATVTGLSWPQALQLAKQNNEEAA